MALPVVVQTTGNAGDVATAGPYSQAFGSNNTAGNALIMGAWTSVATGQTASVTDTQGNVWFPISALYNSSSSAQLWIYMCVNCKAGANTVSISVSGSPTAGNVFCIAEISGVNAVDQLATSLALGNGTTVTMPSITTTQANSIVISLIQNANTALSTVSQTQLGAVPGATSFSNAQYVVEASTGTYNGTFASAGNPVDGAIFNLFQSAVGQGHYVQGVNQLADTGGAITTTQAFTTKNTAAGSLLVAILQVYNTNAIPLLSITDTQSNTWVIASGPSQVTASPYRTYIAYALNTAGGSKPTVTFTWTAATDIFSCALMEYTGVNTLRSATYAAARSGSGSVTTPSIVTVAGDLVLGVIQSEDGDALSTFAAGVSLPFTVRNYYGELSSRIYGVEEDAIATGTSSAADWPNTGVDAFLLAAMAFYDAQVATSTFSPVAGSYSTTQSVTLANVNSGLAGFAQYYTIDGSTPTTGSTLYTGAISVSVSETIKVLAVATGYLNSAIASATYVITAAGGGGVAGLYLAMDASLRNCGLRH